MKDYLKRFGTITVYQAKKTTWQFVAWINIPYQEILFTFLKKVALFSNSCWSLKGQLRSEPSKTNFCLTVPVERNIDSAFGVGTLLPAAVCTTLVSVCIVRCISTQEATVTSDTLAFLIPIKAGFLLRG